MSVGVPCIQPSQRKTVHLADKEILYIGEVDYKSVGCRNYIKDGYERIEYDKRYTPSGLNISMYDLQYQNTVLYRLENKGYYTYTVFPDSSIKNSTYYTGSTRSVIPWSLECELSNDKRFTRENALRLIEEM